MKITPFLEFASVGVGGAIGAIGRWSFAELVTSTPLGLPLSTLAVNVIGCGLIGLAARLIGAERRGRRRVAWLFAVTGILGGFTTFSSFAVETDRLAANGHGATAVLYILLTVLAGLGAVTIAVGTAPVGGEPD